MRAFWSRTAIVLTFLSIGTPVSEGGFVPGKSIVGLNLLANTSGRNSLGNSYSRNDSATPVDVQNGTTGNLFASDSIQVTNPLNGGVAYAGGSVSATWSSPASGRVTTDLAVGVPTLGIGNGQRHAASASIGAHPDGLAGGIFEHIFSISSSSRYVFDFSTSGTYASSNGTVPEYRLAIFSLKDDGTIGGFINNFAIGLSAGGRLEQYLPSGRFVVGLTVNRWALQAYERQNGEWNGGDFTHSTGTFDWYLDGFASQPVPEPTSLAIFGLAAVGLLWRRGKLDRR